MDNSNPPSQPLYPQPPDDHMYHGPSFPTQPPYPTQPQYQQPPYPTQPQYPPQPYPAPATQPVPPSQYPPYPYSQPLPPATPPKKSRRTLWIVLGSVGGVLILCCVVSACISSLSPK